MLLFFSRSVQLLASNTFVRTSEAVSPITAGQVLRTGSGARTLCSGRCLAEGNHCEAFFLTLLWKAEQDCVVYFRNRGARTEIEGRSSFGPEPAVCRVRLGSLPPYGINSSQIRPARPQDFKSKTSWNKLLRWCIYVLGAFMNSLCWLRRGSNVLSFVFCL